MLNGLAADGSGATAFRRRYFDRVRELFRYHQDWNVEICTRCGRHHGGVDDAQARKTVDASACRVDDRIAVA
jgi:hypothetical protein